MDGMWREKERRKMKGEQRGSDIHCIVLRRPEGRI